MRNFLTSYRAFTWHSALATVVPWANQRRGLIFTVVFALAGAWTVWMWYAVFFHGVLTEAERTETRRVHAGVTLDRAALDAAVRVTAARTATAAASAANDGADPFFPEEYRPEKEASR